MMYDYDFHLFGSMIDDDEVMNVACSHETRALIARGITDHVQVQFLKL